MGNIQIVSHELNDFYKRCGFGPKLVYLLIGKIACFNLRSYVTEIWVGLHGFVIGVFQMLIAKQNHVYRKRFVYA